MLREIIKKHKMGLVLAGDIGIFIISILVVLTRYGLTEYSARFIAHRGPFALVLILWLIIFYIFNLYTPKAFNNILEITRRVGGAVLTSFFITITIFYIFSRFFELTPKANLIAVTIIFLLLDIFWRYGIRKVFLHKRNISRVLLLSNSTQVKEIEDYIKNHPQLGYHLIFADQNQNKFNLEEIIKNQNINLIIIDKNSLKDQEIIKNLYRLLPQDIETVILTDFYESLFGCIPLSEIEEEWIVREITKNKNIYESIKRLIEIIISFLGLIILSPLIALITILIKATSPGPIIYKQERAGQNDRPFILYKFRTMIENHNGPLWTEINDKRITPLGRVLRRFRLDEIPQFWNILKGEMSFVGPRAESIELTENYRQIPYYEIRHIIKPGLLGWAQLNYPASTSVEEAEKKFQFDLYYIKNRSLVLDLFITLKTIQRFFKTI